MWWFYTNINDKTSIYNLNTMQHIRFAVINKNECWLMLQTKRQPSIIYASILIQKHIPYHDIITIFNINQSSYFLTDDVVTVEIIVHNLSRTNQNFIEAFYINMKQETLDYHINTIIWKIWTSEAMKDTTSVRKYSPRFNTNFLI